MKRIGRAQWKILAVLTAILVVGATGAYLLIHKARERKTFLGNIDSGYRCRFTLSSVWQWAVTAQGTARAVDPPPPIAVDYAQFDLPPPSPMSKWLSLHLLHPGAVPQDLPKIGLFSYPLSEFPAKFRLIQGYPSPDWQGTAPKHTQSHLFIDGCPATVIYLTTSVTGKPLHCVYLLVYEPTRSFLYCVGGNSASNDSAWFHREMQAIVASFHVEKVPVPAGKH